MFETISNSFSHFIKTFTQFIHQLLDISFLVRKFYSSFMQTIFIHTNKKNFMAHLFTFKKIRLNKIKFALSFILMAAFVAASSHSSAQNVLMGLTSNGSVDGKGTAFSINTNGSNFSVIEGFQDW